MKEKICSATASQLWDHVTFRYDNIRKTRYFLAVANDQEFKFLINQGIDRLMSQVNILEKECQKFGITLPKRPPEVVVAPAGTEMIKDDQIISRYSTRFANGSFTPCRSQQKMHN